MKKLKNKSTLFYGLFLLTVIQLSKNIANLLKTPTVPSENRKPANATVRGTPLLLALLFVLTSQTQAAMRVPTDGTFYPTEDQATLALSALQEECTSALGGGGSFSGSIYKEPVEYNQTTDTYSYLYYLQVSCNTCSSANQTQAIEDYKSTCREQCLSITPLCQAEVWGSTILNTDCDLGLPITTGECAESSSSIESSSSGESSSSVALSSSDEGGSSGGHSSASPPNSSTSVFVDTSLAQVCNTYCGGGGSKFKYYYVNPPPMQSVPALKSYDSDPISSCVSGAFEVGTNIPYIQRFLVNCYSIHRSCEDIPTSTVAYTCFESALTSSKGCASSWPYRYEFTLDGFSLLTGSESRYVLPSNVSVSLLESLVDSAARLMGYSDRFAAANYCRSIYSSSSVAGGSSATPISSSSGDGSSSSEGAYESSSSGSDESSSSSASDAGSSGSAEISSSTSGPESGESSGSVSSSSEGAYESSSSGGEETSSSSSGNDESSSSSASGIDSSCPDCETNVPSAEAVYTSDQIFNSGLENMEDGKCYSLNPDRGTQYGWINNNAQDSWWWVEVPCDGSVPEEETTSAGCVENQRGSNAVYTSADCFSSGLDNMEEGKCYSLNPDRGTQYGWINNNAQDSWWWVETPCEADEYENVCPDDAFLYKKTTAQAIEASSENDSTYTMEIPNLFYDVLGHHISAQMASNTKRFLFVKSRNLLKAAKLSSKQWVSIIFSWTIQGGTTEGTPTATITASLEDFPPSRTRAEVAISMTIENLNINYTEKNPDPLIVAHETEHYNRFISYGKATWNECYMLDYNMTNAQKCAEIKGYSWPLFRDQMYLLIEKQNEWDDTDPNNTSIYRIPVQETIDAMHVYFFSSEVECKF